MMNPRMLERNRLWKRRLTALGVGAFVGLSALIGKQAEQSTVAAVADVPASAPITASTSSALTASVPSAPVTATIASAATIAPTAAPATASSVQTANSAAASAPKVNTRTKSSK